MSKKTKTIRLSHPWPHPHSITDKMYRVEQVTDSTQHDPGKFLDKTVVEDLCASKDWKVTIIPIK
jgi:hypothetical protein